MRRIALSRFGNVWSRADELTVRRTGKDLLANLFSVKPGNLEAAILDHLVAHLCETARLNGCRCDATSVARFHREEFAALVPWYASIDASSSITDILAAFPWDRMTDLLTGRHTQRLARQYARRRECHPTTAYFICYCDEHGHAGAGNTKAHS